MLALEPAAGPIAHIHVKTVATGIAATIQHLFEMPVARIQIMRLGSETFGEISRKFSFEKTFRFLHHAFGDGIRHEQRVTFEPDGQ